MNGVTLIWASFVRHRGRTIFTWLSIVIAFTLFGLLAAVRYGVTGHLSIASAERLDTFNKGIGPLPLSYYSRIAAVPGVVAVVYGTGFAGYFRDKKNAVGIAFLNTPGFVKVFSDFSVPATDLRAYKADRAGAFAGPLVAKHMGWYVGDIIPIEGGPAQQNGSTTWYFHLDGIYRTSLPPVDRQGLYAHYQYFNQGLPPQFRNTVQGFTERVDDPRNDMRIASEIDALFANSSPETLTQPESQEALAATRQFGNVTALVVYAGIAVFFVLLLIIANTLTQSVRERVPEFALFRALGFRRTWIVSLVFRESLMLLVSGAIVGLGAGWLVTRALYPGVEGLLEAFRLTWRAAGSGVALAIVFGIIAALVPIPQITRLCVAAALRSS